jgi:hypothetical protein
MTDPAGSDRIQQDVPIASGTGDDSSTVDSSGDVPLTREDAIERNAAQDDDLPAKAESDVARAERADPPGGA